MIAKLRFAEKVLFFTILCQELDSIAVRLTLAIFLIAAIITAILGCFSSIRKEASMARDLKEEFFRLDGAWASFELMSIRKRDDYLKPFRVLRCKIDDQVDFQANESLRSTTEATVLIEIFGDEELVAASGRGPVHAVDNAMRNILEKHYPQLSEVRLEEFDVRLLHGTAEDDDEQGAAALVRVLAIFSDGRERWGTVGVAVDILQASVECIIDGLEWKLRGEHKH
jgi:2-isopropylmalate synthase